MGLMVRIDLGCSALKTQGGMGVITSPYGQVPS